MRIFGAVMNEMVIVDDGRVALLSITRKAMEELGGTSDDLEGLINFPLTVKDIEAVAFFKEVGDHDWRVSMRSKGNVDIGAIARQFGGGGHTNAAGCSAQGRRSTRAQAVRRAARRSGSQAKVKVPRSLDPRVPDP